MTAQNARVTIVLFRPNQHLREQPLVTSKVVCRLTQCQPVAVEGGRVRWRQQVFQCPLEVNGGTLPASQGARRLLCLGSRLAKRAGVSKPVFQARPQPCDIAGLILPDARPQACGGKGTPIRGDHRQPRGNRLINHHSIPFVNGRQHKNISVTIGAGKLKVVQLPRKTDPMFKPQVRNDTAKLVGIALVAIQRACQGAVP